MMDDSLRCDLIQNGRDEKHDYLKKEKKSPKRKNTKQPTTTTTAHEIVGSYTVNLQ